MNARRLARELALWAGGILGALCFVAVLGGWLFQVTPLVFASGSMSPSYDAGALGIAREVPASELRVGDVVSVRDARGDRVTHRIVAIAARPDGTATLTLKGDANDVADARSYDVAGADRVVAGVPYAGFVLAAASRPAGLAVGGALAAGLLILAFAPRPGAEGRRRSPPAARRPVVVAVGAVAVLAAGGGLGLAGHAPWASTTAVWTDSATADATVTATTPPVPATPVITACVPQNGLSPYTVTWTWAGPGNPDSFKIYYGGGGSGHAPTVVPGDISPRTASTVAINDESGTIRLVAVVGGVESAMSAAWSYAGKNNSKTCHA